MHSAQRLARLPALAAVMALITGCGASDAGQEQAAPPPEVAVATVAVEPIHDWHEFTGRLQAVKSVELRPRVSGYIESVHFEEGSRVEAGTTLFQIDPRPFKAEVERLTAERERARAELDLAVTNHERAERLFKENAISREELDSLSTARAMAKAELGAVEAALETARLDLEFTTVTAPIDGRVSTALVTAGNLVDSSTLLTTLVSDDPIYAYFHADEQSYLDYVNGQDTASARNAKVYLGFINESGYPHEGRLDFLDNQVNAESGTIRGRAVLDNPDGRFTPGLFVRLRLVSPETKTVALVDDRAIGTDLDQKYVLVLDDQNVAQYRGVRTGRLIDNLRVVTKGLEAGDRVIVNGLQRVRPGAPVAPTQVAMDRSSRELERLAASAGAGQR
ncbi:MAG TPA: efflux RND transporter periplasmic adaptor subunit [Woeseiaceae bacterium]|nr:efflux RND transporter periplasmic adaptor subunit [Woeseiaceae bacterium]